MCHKTEKIIQEQRFPRFISNRAVGDDKLKGESQNRLASAIQRHIESTDSSLRQENCLPRIIGIEGSWGSGKTNVVRNLKKKLFGSYYVFEYDAWGHQEDLQRRAILETLTTELIENEFLPKEKKVVKDSETGNFITWSDKLKHLLSHRRVTEVSSVPVLNGGALWIASILALSALSMFVAERFDDALHWAWQTLIAFSPIILGFLFWFILSRFIKSMRGIGYFLTLSKEGSSSTCNYETINEEEPTVAKFKQWMLDLDNYISKFNSEKLILVFDNMDRLEPVQVREFWSSVHTFFAEGHLRNIWAIIPYDRRKLENTFEGNPENVELFLQKTFPVIYSVALPVISDYKDIFYKFYLEAFGPEFLSHVDEVSRIYRLSKQSPNVRDIIIFINKLVALYQLWGECISLKSMALYALNLKKLEENPESKILSGDFLKDNNINRIIEYDIQIQTEIAALYYGITVEHAMQIPLSNYILKTIEGKDGYDINAHAENDNFYDILENVIEKEDDVRLNDIVINCLSKLLKQNHRVASIWAGVATRYCKNRIESLSFSQVAKQLLLHTKDGVRQLIVNHLFNEFQTYKEMSGAQYYIALRDLDCFLKENEISETYVDVSLNLSPKEYVDYLRQAEGEYEKYAVRCNAEDLDRYLSDELCKETYEIVDVVNLLKSDAQYAFPTLKAALKANITGKMKITPHYVGENLASYRLLCEDRIDTFVNVSECTSLEQSMRNEKITEGYIDLVASLIANNQSLSNVSIEMVDIKELADIVLRYISMNDLLIYAYNNSNNRVVKDLMHHMISNSIGEEFDVKHMAELESYKMQFSIDEKDILEYTSEFVSDETLNSISEDKLISIIPEGSNLYKAATLSTCALCKRINETLTAYLNIKCTGQTMSYNRSNYTTVFTHKAIGYLIDTAYLSPTPQYLEEFALAIFKGVDADTYRLPLNEYEEKVLNRLNLSSVSIAIKDVIDKYCQDPSKVMSPSKFMFYEKWIRAYGNLDKSYDRFTHRILEKVVDDKAVLDIILENSEYYINVINNAGNDSKVLKDKIIAKIKVNGAGQLTNFARRIGINASES